MLFLNVLLQAIDWQMQLCVVCKCICEAPAPYGTCLCVTSSQLLRSMLSANCCSSGHGRLRRRSATRLSGLLSMMGISDPQICAWALACWQRRAACLSCAHSAVFMLRDLPCCASSKLCSG